MNATEHLDDLREALDRLVPQAAAIERHGHRIGRALAGGARLLALGNGGSAAHAEHLTAELVGRFDGDRRPLAGIAIGAEYPAMTAITNDYGPDDAFVRPVRAHGRPGDVLVALSTSGRSSNVLAAVAAAHERGLSTLALTGPAPNPLASASHDAITVDATRTATVQEVHQVLIHLLCLGIDEAVSQLDVVLGARWTT